MDSTTATKKNVSGPQLARVFDCTPQWISQLVARGMPKTGRNSYPVGECLIWYVRFLKKSLDSRNARPDDELMRELRQEKVRRSRADAELSEIKLGEKKGQVIPIEVFELQMGTMIATARTSILTLPARLAPQLEGENRTAIKSKLQNAIHGALTSLAMPEAYQSGGCPTCGQAKPGVASPTQKKR